MNTEFTALTRPRTAAGVSSCTKVDRMTTLTMSAAPVTAKAAMESHQQTQRHSHCKQARAHRMGDEGTQRINESTQRWATDDCALHCALHCGCRGCKRAQQQALRDQERGQDQLRWYLKYAPGPKNHRRHQQQASGAFMDVRARRLHESHQYQYQNPHLHLHLHSQAHSHDPPTIVAVDQVSGPKGQRQGRRKLWPSNQAQVSSRAGAVVHLPSDGDHQHLVGCHADNAGHPRLQDRPLRQQRLRVLCHGLRCRADVSMRQRVLARFPPKGGTFMDEYPC